MTGGIAMAALNVKNLKLLENQLEVTKNGNTFTISGRRASKLHEMFKDAGITVGRLEKGGFTVTENALSESDDAKQLLSRFNALASPTAELHY